MRMKTLLLSAAALSLPAALTAQVPADPNAASAQNQAPGATADAATDGAANATAQAGELQVAAKADVTTGAPVLDQTGAPVGKIESVTADGAVVSTGKVRAQIPFGSFGKSEKGLVIAMTKAELEAQAGGKKGS